MHLQQQANGFQVDVAELPQEGLARIVGQAARADVKSIERLDGLAVIRQRLAQTPALGQRKAEATGIQQQRAWIAGLARRIHGAQVDLFGFDDLVLAVQRYRQRGQGRCRIRMQRAQGLLEDRQRATLQRLGFCGFALLVQHRRQIVERIGQRRMVGTQRCLLDGQRAPVQPFDFAQRLHALACTRPGTLLGPRGALVLALLEQDVRQVVQAGGGVRMIGSEHLFTNSEGLAMRRFRLRQLALQVAHIAQIGQAGGGERVVRTQRAQINAQHAVVQRFGFVQLPLRSQRFGARQQLLRVVALLRRSRHGGSRCRVAVGLPVRRCRRPCGSGWWTLVGRSATGRGSPPGNAVTQSQRGIGPELALAVQHSSEIGQRRRRVRVIIALRPGQNGVRASQQEFGAGVIGLAFQHQRQIVQGRSGIDGICARAPLVDFQRQAKQ